jgi:hypothetical protein
VDNQASFFSFPTSIEMDFFVTSTEARDEPLEPTKALANHARFSNYIDAISSKRKNGEEPEEIDQCALAEEALQTWIYVYGRTQDGKSACVKVEFDPHFYIEPPASWGTLSR